MEVGSISLKVRGQFAYGVNDIRIPHGTRNVDAALVRNPHNGKYVMIDNSYLNKIQN
jgi:hypothetical protein